MLIFDIMNGSQDRKPTFVYLATMKGYVILVSCYLRLKLCLSGAMVTSTKLYNFAKPVIISTGKRIKAIIKRKFLFSVSASFLKSTATCLKLIFSLIFYMT